MVAKWKSSNKKHLTGIAIGGHPKKLIDTLAENLLETFQEARLLDAYDVYQHLLNYWAEVMQDDLYMLVQDGWKAVLDGKPNTELIPQALLEKRYFSAGLHNIEQLETERDALTRQMEELEEEHGGDEGLLAEAKNDKNKLTKASAKTRLTEIKDDKDADEERRLLNEFLTLVEKEAAANKLIKEAQKALEKQVAAQYAKLSEAEVKALVVEDKWLAVLAVDIQTELDRVSQALTGRVKELAERYATPLPKLNDEVQTLAARVDEHLRKMGAVWK